MRWGERVERARVAKKKNFEEQDSPRFMICESSRSHPIIVSLVAYRDHAKVQYTVYCTIYSVYFLLPTAL